MEQGYLAQVQALIDQKWKENPEEMKRVMEEIEAKEKAKKEKPKVEKLTQELIEELHKNWDVVDISKVQDLIKRGADVGAENTWGRTPLHFASISNYIEIAKLLIELGADLEAKDNNRDTPLHWASSWNRIETAKLLIERGADVEAKDVFGATPLDKAYSDEMRDLLQKYMKK